jgi:rare lipoprotein A
LLIFAKVMQKKISLIYFLLTILFVANLHAQSNIPMDTASNIPTFFYQEGKASYYANSLHGRRTASGEKYSKKKLTAAHLTLPLGTRVKVTNKKTGKWVIVTINDRGPYSKKYIIDLSYRAAKHLGMTQGKGYAKVVIEEQPKKDQPWPQKHVPEPAGQGLQK